MTNAFSSAAVAAACFRHGISRGYPPPRSQGETSHMSTTREEKKAEQVPSRKPHLASITVDVLKDFANVHAWDEPQRQHVQGGRENKLPFAGEDRRTVREAVVRRRVRVLPLGYAFTQRPNMR